MNEMTCRNNSLKYMTNLPLRATGFGHPKCFLNKTKDCCNLISGEHPISKSLLLKITSGGKSIKTGGSLWLPSGESKVVAINSLVSNNLCASHNSRASIFDSEMLKLTDAIEVFSKNLDTVNQQSRNLKIDGTLIERWILKMMMGLLDSRQIGPREVRTVQLKSSCLKLMCNPRVRWPLGWGLYIAVSNQTFKIEPGISITPFDNTNTGDVVLVRISIYGLDLVFMMENPGNLNSMERASIGSIHPNRLVFINNSVESSIDFDWHNKSTTDSLAVIKVSN